jgi:hypothetical protein
MDDPCRHENHAVVPIQQLDAEGAVVVEGEQRVSPAGSSISAVTPERSMRSRLSNSSSTTKVRVAGSATGAI